MHADNNDIDYIRERVLRKFPLLGVTMSALNTVADDNIGTAATDGRTVYYSPKFFAPLSDDEKTFIYAHEVMHVAFNHILRSKDKKQRLWNMATDAVINQILKNEELPMIDGGVDMAEAFNKSAEEMYERLLKEQEEKEKEKDKDKNQQQQNESHSAQQPEGNKQQNAPQPQDDNQPSPNSPQEQENNDGDGEESEQAGHDNHNIWKKAVEMAEKEKQQQEEQQKGNSPTQKQEKSGQSILDKLKDLFKKPEKPVSHQ